VVAAPASGLVIVALARRYSAGKAAVAPSRRGANVNDGHGRVGRIAEATHLETSRHALTV
jgi:hypothetical protein